MPHIEWQTIEFEKHEKSATWYAVLWSIAVALGGLAFFTENYLVVGLILVGALVVSIYAAKDPQQLKVSIDDDALHINSQTFSLKEFSSFWIIERGDHAIISLHRKGIIRPNLRIIMPSDFMGKVRMLLRPSVSEEEHEESLIDLLAERLKF